MDVYINGEKREALEREPSNIHDLVEHLNVGQPQAKMTIEVNGEEVNHAQWLQHGIEHDDEVRIDFEA